MDNFSTYESFKHGLIISKIWLCEELEKAVDANTVHKPTLHILAGWQNILTFMLLIRRPYFYHRVFSYDIDQTAIKHANEICDTWRFEEPRVENIHTDINSYIDFSIHENNIFINCSVDQIYSLQWYNNIPTKSLVCFQSTDICDPNYPWYIKTFSQNLVDFSHKFPLTETYFIGEKNITYGQWGYKRFMIIGIK